MPAFETIADFWEPSQALFFQSLLEAHDIPAFVVGEHTGNIAPVLSLFRGSARGGIRLQVYAEDADRARDLIAQRGEFDEDLDPDSDPETDEA